jgi:8-oxo-dGTP diphosphatase
VSYTYQYPRPSVTVDACVFGVDSGALKLLLIRRAAAPFKGEWALPGGFVQMGESLDDAARRELQEETGVTPSYMEQLYTFGEPKRDPRGRVISIAYLALVKLTEAVAASDADDARWFAVDELPDLAFDHGDIIRMAKRRLRNKVRYAPIGFDLLPTEFSLVELQALYEILLGRGVDKANFRKKVLGMGLLRETGRKSSSPRPAALFSFDTAEYERLTRRGFNFEL